VIFLTQSRRDRRAAENDRILLLAMNDGAMTVLINVNVIRPKDGIVGKVHRP
jgi:hypothetical protein